MKNKKSQITLIILIVASILLLVVLPFSVGFTAYFLSKNIFTLLGLFFVIIGGIGMFKGFNPQIALVLMGVGLFLIMLPFISSSLGGVNLAVVLGK